MAKSRYSGMTHVLEMRYKRIEIPAGVSVKKVAVTEGTTWRKLAWQWLDTAEYYWVLLDINKENNSFAPLEGGRVVKIPGKEIKDVL